VTETTVARPAKAAHLHSVDVVRVLTIALVIGVHTTSQQPGGLGAVNGALLNVMHVSREVFFLLTAFVLSYSYRDRAPARWWGFWRRRYWLIGVPYLAWSLTYFFARGERAWPIGHALRAFGAMVIDGTASYHLYFLLVSMQMYLVFPLLRRLLWATRRRPAWLLVPAAAYQLAVYTLAQVHPDLGPFTKWLHDPSPYLSTYLGFVIAGGVAAMHADAFLAWTRDHARWIYAGCAVSVVAGVAVFFVQLWGLGQPPIVASSVFQPVVVVESIAVAWTFLALGLAWQARRTPGRRFVRAAADASFGVYLAHPLLLQGLLAASAATGLTAAAARLPDALVTAVSMVIVVPLIYLTCAAAADVIRRTPLSLALTGRTRHRPGSPKPMPAPTAVPGPEVPATAGGMRCERQTA
jgi:peptidoglycan/LPS O-acetylase OafA/YrhL